MQFVALGDFNAAAELIADGDGKRLSE